MEGEKHFLEILIMKRVRTKDSNETPKMMTFESVYREPTLIHLFTLQFLHINRVKIFHLNTINIVSVQDIMIQTPILRYYQSFSALKLANNY
jgi:hypothetical protein